MAIVKSKRDERIRKDTGISSNLNAQAYHDLVEQRRGTTSQVSNLTKKYKLNLVPDIVDTTNLGK